MKLLVPILSCLNYVSAYLLLFLWNESISYLIAVCVASFSIGTIVEDYPRSLLYSSVFQALGAIIAIGISTAPSAIYGAGIEIVDVAILWYGSIAIKMSLISLPLCVFLAFIGHSIAESLAVTV